MFYLTLYMKVKRGFRVRLNSVLAFGKTKLPYL